MVQQVTLGKYFYFMVEREDKVVFMEIQIVEKADAGVSVEKVLTVMTG